MFKVLLLIAGVILTGCILLWGIVALITPDDISKEFSNHRELFNEMSLQGIKECDDKGMEYVTISEPYYATFQVYCAIPSPYTLYVFEVS